MGEHADLNLSDFIIQDGKGADGGGVDNAEGNNLTVTGCTFTKDKATADGGAIDNSEQGSSSTLTVTDSTFTDDSARDDGGAIDDPNGTVTLIGSTFSSDVGANGGALDIGDAGANATLTATSSTFSSDTATFGGGAIDLGDDNGGGSAAITTSTFSATTSTAGDGGAIDSGDDGGYGDLSVTSSTFAGNTAPQGDGPAIDNADLGGGGSGDVTVGDDVFTTSCDQGSSTWTDDGYNVSSDATCFSATPAAGDTDAAGSALSSELGGLADHGGPTQTPALLTGNPAISLIPDPTSTQCPVSADQRGDASASGRPVTPERCNTPARASPSPRAMPRRASGVPTPRAPQPPRASRSPSRWMRARQRCAR